MSALVSNMFLLMIAALLIGFLIGWFIRRSATRTKYSRNIDDLMSEDDHMASELHINSVNYENNTRHLTNTQDKLVSAQKQSEEYLDHSKKLETDIENFHLSQKALEADLEGMDGKIQNVTGELDILNSQKAGIQESQNTIVQYEDNIAQKTGEIETLREQVSYLTSEREAHNTKATNENKNISSKEQEINIELDKIKAIEDEFSTKRAEIRNDVESTKRKALNYQYAVNYVNEKMDAQEGIDFDTIDKIINKNEEKSFFENLIQKLFSKSAQYIKGGK